MKLKFPGLKGTKFGLASPFYPLTLDKADRLVTSWAYLTFVWWPTSLLIDRQGSIVLHISFRKLLYDFG